MDIAEDKEISLCEKNCKRNRVLSSAATLFTRHGYHGTSINDISKDSSVDKASIYYYFQDKADIAHSVFNCIATFYENHLLSPIKTKNLPQRQLAIKFIDDLNNLIEAGHAWLILAYDVGIVELPKLQASIDSHIETWTNLLSSFVTPIEHANLNEKMVADVSFELIIASMRAEQRSKHTNSSKICLKRLLKSLWLN